ncbi:SOS response-associated peptidase [Bradyrhizobium sp. U87765 SZCCT0131]|uniref:SOS response-associated peptidase n=1 Tax=unclassified Bradyrhizobium TaxID=2631580 RepID=UPI001BAA79E7|nr:MULTISPECIES: SOS response-associated peptidase [unclassified Bradyrhizobium]MBR1221465.1 SOS response-associated peptidase [Bradyrhizobium sp. U87765 SZCCT0131]MBR1264612.1 SOS response-associated peptidase [Bradyrhizobium sp. U87765 SZCCT0134]MBR1304482.1 SOS response-associated peptidase [Bradyrhizobium sp. U87765 SZCCT0110]MBR1322661.1 SOS response-associated peptidase [Bradyrhizobium sp. U87765 SZCCT0109]MBR1346411.1 SOS response-associated peptidase [Bradyrhizobium sp. U87765 SZCCT004
MSAFPSASRTEASAPGLAAAKDTTIEAEAAQLLPVWRYHPETGKPVETQMRWGLIPFDADRRPDFRPIHARAESIAEKRIFAGAYRRRRCVVPMTSFYLKDARGKRHTISLLTREPFGVAGIWDNWKDPETSRWERTFAIVTVPANALLATIHDRMPAILNPTEFPRWMGGEPDPRDLLKPFTSEELDVSPGLGKPRRR